MKKFIFLAISLAVAAGLAISLNAQDNVSDEALDTCTITTVCPSNSLFNCTVSLKTASTIYSLLPSSMKEAAREAYNDSGLNSSNRGSYQGVTYSLSQDHTLTMTYQGNSVIVKNFSRDTVKNILFKSE